MNFQDQKIINPFGDDKDFSGCAIFAMMNTERKRFSSKDPVRAIKNMHDRGIPVHIFHIYPYNNIHPSSLTLFSLSYIFSFSPLPITACGCICRCGERDRLLPLPLPLIRIGERDRFLPLPLPLIRIGERDRLLPPYFREEISIL